jgi:tRNA threonylcarbamoyladenosine biosynthesis protein TsaB
MLVLGLDTATRATAVALCGDGRGGVSIPSVERRDDPVSGARAGHAAHLLELTVDALAGAGIGWDQVDRIAVGVGPGTFTGLRIGVASARALAQARSIELVGVSTLQSLALLAAPAARAAGAELVAGVIDARRGELFACAWELDTVERPDARPALEARPYKPAALVDALRGLNRNALAVGDGALAFKAQLERGETLVPADDSGLHRVSAIGHCRLGRVLAPGPAGGVLPAYLRLPDAELSKRSAQS